MKIVFMGTPEYATKIFAKLVEQADFEVVLLVTQQDKPVGRKQVLTPPNIKQWANEHLLDIEIYQPKTLKNEETQAHIASFAPDFIVVAAYGQILPKAILDIAPCINLHASLLPKYRGASPIQSAILNQEIYSGVTAMLMNEGLDTGKILSMSYIQTRDKCVDALFDEMSECAATLTLATLRNFNSISPLSQVDTNATHCKKIKKEDGLINFTDESAYTLYVKSLAYKDWPGIFLDSGLKLRGVSVFNKHKQEEPLKILSIHKSGIEVACKQGTVLINELQPVSKKFICSLDYINGKRLSVGDILV
ncbi:MAG: methionyl-tRNA formyltransferase [Sulfurospirillaceae bacterium]|nr:methionyl-tRNA formyltransferase [Sulfurospirillaceae bacterium]MDD3463691.1 methionyl-tRNA formyltransferase [Sulfurospirillaceae bacterium]